MVSSSGARNSSKEEREKVVEEAIEELSKLHYGFESMLGNGTYGDVVKIYSSESGTYKAAKVIVQKNVVEKEIILWSTLNHDNVLPLEKTFALKSKAVVFISPLLFKAFDEIITDRRFSRFAGGFLFVNKWLVDTLKGIDYIHRKQICHLDLKLDNVLISSQGVARVCDFSFVNSTVEGVMPEDVGLPAIYRPPEMFKRKSCRKMDGTKIDVWTYGILAVEAFTIQQLHRRLEKCSSWDRDVKPVLKLMLEERIFEVLLKDSYALYNFKGGEATDILDFIGEFLRPNPSKRTTAFTALRHGFVRHAENVEINLEDIFRREELQKINEGETSAEMNNVQQYSMNDYERTAESSSSNPDFSSSDESQTNADFLVSSSPARNSSDNSVTKLSHVRDDLLLPHVTKKKLKRPKVKLMIKKYNRPLRRKPTANGASFHDSYLEGREKILKETDIELSLADDSFLSVPEDVPPQ